MIYSKKQLYLFTRQLYKLFHEKPDLYTLRKLRNDHGRIDWENVTPITLDYRRDIVAALIHEAIHYMHQDMAETHVLEMERNILNQLSVRQVKNILKRFAEIL